MIAWTIERYDDAALVWSAKADNARLARVIMLNYVAAMGSTATTAIPSLRSPEDDRTREFIVYRDHVGSTHYVRVLAVRTEMYP